jgi:hypothetical protein
LEENKLQMLFKEVEEGEVLAAGKEGRGSRQGMFFTIS